MTNTHQNEYKAMTYKELKDGINEATELAEMLNEYRDKLPEGDREQFGVLSFRVFECLGHISIMLEEKALVYNRKRERHRLNQIAKEENE